MAAALRYGGGRPIFFTLVLAVLYLVVLPGNWPEPSVETAVPSAGTLGEDLTIDVTARAWHPNFQVRQISFSVRNVSSTALVYGKKPFVPVNLVEREKTDRWQVGFGKRATWPRSRSFRLTVPLRKLALERQLRAGVLQGSIDVVVDHTRVTTSGYPPLTSSYRIPYSLTIGR
jgi:hypothetical protein